MVPQVGGLLLGDVGQQIDQRTHVDDLLSAVASVEEVRIVFTGNLGAQRLVQVACQEFDFEGDAEFFFDHLVDLVVIRGLVTGIATEHGYGNGLQVVGHGNAHHGQKHRQCHYDCQQFTHR